MKCSELLRLLKSDGWVEVRQKGSHISLRHPVKTVPLVVPNHTSKEIKKGLLHDIPKKAGIKTTKR
jgi:predicted RNA binding protein YcfA (HicA-like mRNA interferase family)